MQDRITLRWLIFFVFAENVQSILIAFLGESRTLSTNFSFYFYGYRAILFTFNSIWSAHNYCSQKYVYSFKVTMVVIKKEEGVTFSYPTATIAN